MSQIGPAVESSHNAMNTVRSQQNTPSATLRINAFTTAVREILSPLILEFLRRHPPVQIDLVTEGRLFEGRRGACGAIGLDLFDGETITLQFAARRILVEKSGITPAPRCIEVPIRLVRFSEGGDGPRPVLQRRRSAFKTGLLFIWIARACTPREETKIEGAFVGLGERLSPSFA